LHAAWLWPELLVRKERRALDESRKVVVARVNFCRLGRRRRGMCLGSRRQLTSKRAREAGNVEK
jgi:hypothetical protein